MSAFSFSVAPSLLLCLSSRLFLQYMSCTYLGLILRLVWMTWNKAISYCSFSCLSIDGIPYDGVPEEEIVTVHIAATSILYILATCGIIMTIVFLNFNFAFRERKWVVIIQPAVIILYKLYERLLHTCMYVYVCGTVAGTCFDSLSFHGIICL